MREIKFRAWDKGSENMHSNVQNGVYEDPDEWTEFNTVLGLERFEVMQYTGLKDKNGKEIYEGDVVKGHWWERGKSHRHIGRVAYVMSAYKVRGVKKYFGMDDELNPTYEIIGNIYENPVLLEVN